MKKSSLLGLLLSSIILTGCVGGAQPSQPASKKTTPAQEATQKQGDTTRTGQVNGSAGKYFLTVSGSDPIGLESYSVDLQEYVGKTVTITGQYSGDTLFVGKIEL